MNASQIWDHYCQEAAAKAGISVEEVKTRLANDTACLQISFIAEGERSIEMIDDDYANVTPLQWAEYEFATIEHDYKIHPSAAKAIRSIFERLANGR